ncbi:MAG: aldo/keto reductase [Ignavibacteriales bacterium]|nr:aldo/keto reductase [Ignavibacteriales bacterium]
MMEFHSIKKLWRKHYISGINVIDTSSNYSDGGSEILVGKVLNKLISDNQLSRDEIIVVSKGGYLARIKS